MYESVMILRKCHINSKYKGYQYIPYAVDIMVELTRNNERNIYITKDVYPVVAKKFHTSPTNIEAVIRNTIEKCWRENKHYVQKILGYESVKCPSNTEFIDAIAFYVKHGT